MKTRKFTALLLVLCLLLTAVPYSAPAVYATEDEHLAQEQPQEQTQTKLIDAPLLVEGTDLPTRANSTFFKYVDEAVFEAGNHVARIPEEETLSTYVFRNNDGTKTVYYLPDNVKYFAQDGTVVEKDLTLVAKTGGYGVSRSDIDYLLPTSAASGIRLQHGSKEVTLIPQAQSGRVGTAAISGDSVRYANYFGTGIHLVYTPMPSGLKEDIVLDSYTGMHSFTFLLNTNGMRLYNEDGQYYLATSADAEEKMYLGQIVVYDAKGEPCPGTMSITTVTMGQQYQITVSADPDFLTNPNTEYPVTIDPTLEISDNEQGAGSIEDASVYENKPTVNAGSWTYNHCGYYTSSSTVYGVSRTVYRLTGLINDTTWASIDPADIVSAKLYVKEASGKSGITLNIRALGNTTWTETGVTWNTLGGHYPTVYASAAPGYGAWGEWDITGLAIAWKYLTRSIQAGFEMVSEDEFTESRTLYASEYGTVDRRPYFTVTYNYDTDGLSITQKEISVGNSFVLYWPDVTAPITWHSSNTAVATVSSTGVVTGINPGIATITASADNYTSRTCTVYVLLKDGVYYISSAHSISLGTGGTQTNLSHMKTYTKATSGTERYHQLWEINHISNGRYSIRSIGNGNLLLSRDEDYAVGLMQSASLTVPTQARWTIEYTSMGYKILNAGNSSYALTVDGPNTTPNQEVKTVSYAQNSYRAHWLLQYTSIYSMQINAYYDNAFDVRYDDSDLLIHTMMQTVQRVYQDGFSLNISYASPTKIQSTPDNCKMNLGLSINSSTIDLMCPGNPEYDGNHICSYYTYNHNLNDDWLDCTSPYQIYADFILLYPGSSQTTSILFTGNALYDNTGESFIKSYSSYNNGILMNGIFADSTAYRVNRIGTLIHELAHQLDAPDHYHDEIEDENGNKVCRNKAVCSVCNSEAGRPTDCIMYRTQGINLSGSIDQIFCTDCYNDILEHLSSHH